MKLRLLTTALALTIAGAAVQTAHAQHEPGGVKKEFPVSSANGKGRKPPPPPLPPPPPPPKTVTGTVVMSVADGGMPVAGALLDVWVQTRTTGYLFGRFVTDSLGRFNISGVPNNSTVQLHAGGSGGLQPCAAIGQYTTTNGLTKTITIFSIE